MAAAAAVALLSIVSTADRPLVYLDIDVDGHAAAFGRAKDFVHGTDKRYGWSSPFLSALGGSERSRIREAYESDFEWSTKGPIELDPAPHTRMVIALYADSAPNCAQNFACMCTGEKGKAKGSSVPLNYSGSRFHRMVKGSLIQGGDIVGGRFKDEKAALKTAHSKRGLLSMCNTGPNSNGSQFFLTFGALPKLNGKHCVFGEVVHGLEVLDIIEQVDVDSGGVPKKPITIVGAGRLDQVEGEPAQTTNKKR